MRELQVVTFRYVDKCPIGEITNTNMTLEDCIGCKFHRYRTCDDKVICDFKLKDAKPKKPEPKNPIGVKCPKCGSVNVMEYFSKNGNHLYYKCQDCNYMWWTN